MNLSYILKDARKNREDNRLYFYSLVLVFIVSYTVLSFDKTEISTFLYQENIFFIKNYLIESYIYSLVFILTLIFFSSKNQLDYRKKEFALLMMLGERRKNISKRLSLEAIFNSILALVIAFPIAIFLNEFINLFVIKVLQLGLKSHRLRISFGAVITTSLVVIILQIISIRLISFFILRKETYKLIYGKNKEEIFKKKKINEKKSFYISIFLLTISIYFSLFFGAVVFPCALGIIISLFFFYRGFPYILDKLSKNNLEDIFEIRLIEEKFKYEYKSLFFTNFLMIISFILLILPLAQSFFLRNNNKDVPDFTIYDGKEAVEKMYKEEKYKKVLENPQPFYLSQVKTDKDQTDNLIEINLIGENMDVSDMYDYIIKKSSIDQLFEKMGKESVDIKDNEAMIVFENFDNYDYYKDKLGDILPESEAVIGTRHFKIIPRFEPNDIFSNKQVFWSGGLVVSDDVYDQLALNDKAYAYNFFIKSSYKNKEGTIKASETIRDMMIEDGLKYESKIWQLKTDISDLVTDLYINLYLGILLFIIVNTYIAFKFLYWVKLNRERFAIKKLLGEDPGDTRKRMERIIYYYFAFLFVISFLVNLAFFKSNIVNVGNKDKTYRYFAYINICLVVFELIYIGVIKKITRNELEK
ncbi:MAG: ABC transporter permease [Peptoniphilaceae bacterium]|nr:ABC transporter permease [Peptoniphilaceae bacterium]MDY6019747.1 ABC transporter permease [Anaerococcus sp.]